MTIPVVDNKKGQATFMWGKRVVRVGCRFDSPDLPYLFAKRLIEVATPQRSHADIREGDQKFYDAMAHLRYLVRQAVTRLKAVCSTLDKEELAAVFNILTSLRDNWESKKSPQTIANTILRICPSLQMELDTILVYARHIPSIDRRMFLESLGRGNMSGFDSLLLSLRYVDKKEAKQAIAAIGHLGHREYTGITNKEITDQLREPYSLLAREIHKHRMTHGLKQSQFADNHEFTQADISKWESGRHKPKGKNLKKLFKILGVEQSPVERQKRKPRMPTHGRFGKQTGIQDDGTINLTERRKSRSRPLAN